MLVILQNKILDEIEDRKLGDLYIPFPNQISWLPQSSISHYRYSQRYYSVGKLALFMKGYLTEIMLVQVILLDYA